MEKSQQIQKTGLVLLGLVIGVVIGFFACQIFVVAPSVSNARKEYEDLLNDYNNLVDKYNKMAKEIEALNEAVNEAIDNYNRQSAWLRDPEKLLDEILDALNSFFATV